MHRTQRRLRRRDGSHRLSIGLVALACTACTLFEPVPPEARSARLWQPAGRDAGAIRSAEAGSECESPSRFAGDLDLAICVADAQRLAYVEHAAVVLNAEASYNALLWPLGAAAVYEKLRGAGNRSLLLPAALASASYGLMTSGIPDREANYLAAARRLACAIGAAGADLYPRTHVDTRAWPYWQPESPSLVPLEPAVTTLRTAVANYEAERTLLLADAKPRPASATRSSNVTYLDAVFALTGRGGAAGRNSVPQLEAETKAKLAGARKRLAQGDALLRRLQSGAAAQSLRQEAADVEAELQQQLAAKAPPPALPANVAATLVANTQAVVQLQGAVAERDGEALDAGDAALSSKALDGLHPDTAKRVAAFQRDQAVPLWRALLPVDEWLARHAAERDELARTLAAAGCVAAGSALPATTRPRTAARPATSVGGASTNEVAPAVRRLEP